MFILLTAFETRPSVTADHPTGYQYSVPQSHALADQRMVSFLPNLDLTRLGTILGYSTSAAFEKILVCWVWLVAPPTALLRVEICNLVLDHLLVFNLINRFLNEWDPVTRRYGHTNTVSDQSSK